jgi:hypothetical protein
MLEKISAFWNLFRQGEAVADPRLWKTRQITVTAVAGFLMALVATAKALGYEIPFDQDAANAVGAGVIAVANVVLTLISSKTVGVLPPVRPSDPPSAPSDSGNGA